MRDCCECGADTSPFDLVAIRGDAEPELTSLICDPATTCLACVPDYAASGASAHCVSGRCEVSVP